MTLSEMWLAAASKSPRTDVVSFRSGRKWATAARLLRQLGTVPILFRQQDEPGDVLRCRFVAHMVKIDFRDGFATDNEARACLDEHLWRQRQTMMQLPRSERYPTWESQ